MGTTSLGWMLFLFVPFLFGNVSVARGRVDAAEFAHLDVTSVKYDLSVEFKF